MENLLRKLREYDGVDSKSILRKYRKIIKS
jgi:hypothetical protein